MSIEAELKRRDEDENLVAWKLVDDPSNATTGRSDPVVDAGVRSRLDAGIISLSPLIPEQYDAIELGYTGDDITSVVYKQGAATVGTLTLGYAGGRLSSVVRS